MGNYNILCRRKTHTSSDKEEIKIVKRIFFSFPLAFDRQSIYIIFFVFLVEITMQMYGCQCLGIRVILSYISVCVSVAVAEMSGQIASASKIMLRTSSQGTEKITVNKRTPIFRSLSLS
jgi:hypothetical protein